MDSFQAQEEQRQALIEMALQAQSKLWQIEQENHELEQMATTDVLTGLANRAKWDSFIPVAFMNAKIISKPLAVLFIDMDRFKSINDTLGHLFGDAVLQSVGKIIRTFVGPDELAARYGGEELSVALLGCDLADGVRMAERIRRAIMEEQICVEGQKIQATASIGVAALDDRFAFASAAELVRAADAAVYAAKAAGRNCVRAAKPESLVP